MGFLKRLLSSSDRFTTGLVISVILAVIFPCRGVADTIVSQVGDIAVMLLFFLYGAKLSRRSWGFYCALFWDT
jgi:sodium/bile acid cotransporter 7